MIKKINSEETRQRKIYLNIIKTTYDKPIASIILNGKNNKFPQKPGVRQECPGTTLNILLNALSREVRQEKEIREIPMGTGEVTKTLLADGIILLTRNLKDFMRKFLHLIKTFNEVFCSKIQNQSAYKNRYLL